MFASPAAAARQEGVRTPGVVRNSWRWLALAAALAGLFLGLAIGTPGASAANAKVPLVVYAAEGYDAAMTAAFQKATGIPTTLYDDHTGIVVAKIEAERSNPQWGLVWLDGDQALYTLNQQGQLVRGWRPTVSYTTQGKAFVPSDHSYLPTGFTVAGAIFYNSSQVSNPPATWQDLLSPRFSGKVGILNPAIDGPAYPVYAGFMQQRGGVGKGEQFISQLKGNGAQLFTDPHVELAALESGQINVMIAQSAYGIGAAEKSPNIKGVYPRYVTPVPSVIGIDKKVSAAEQAEAKKFITYVLSPAGQQVMKSGDPTGDSLFWPVLTGESSRPQLPPLAATPIKVLSPSTWGPREQTVNNWFSATIAK